MHIKLFKYGCTTLFVAQHLSKLAMALDKLECHSETCHPVEQYCSQFEQTCMNCSKTCDSTDIMYEPSVCSQQCSDFIKLQPLKTEIHVIQMQQNVILTLLILLLAFTVGHFTWKLLKCLYHQRCVHQLMKKLKLRKEIALPTTHGNGKDLDGITIPNMCAINDLNEKEPSQIYSLAGAEGSVRTVTTPINTRHPAENTTPSPQPNEYSYDNEGLVVTPISEKPNGRQVFS